MRKGTAIPLVPLKNILLENSKGARNRSLIVFFSIKIRMGEYNLL